MRCSRAARSLSRRSTPLSKASPSGRKSRRRETTWVSPSRTPAPVSQTTCCRMCLSPSSRRNKREKVLASDWRKSSVLPNSPVAVRIETRLGQGTAVKIFLPRAGVDVADHQAGFVDASKRPQTMKRLRVLVVDDDKAVLKSTVRMLDCLEYATASAESGSEALRVLASNQEIDLVLADFAMPEMSGGELAKAICAMRPTLPVILITGYSDLAVLKELNDLRIILKPFTEDDLVNA